MNNEIMREEILTFIEKNSRVDLKELAIIVGTDEVTVANEMAAMEKELRLSYADRLGQDQHGEGDSAHRGARDTPARRGL